jgi:hypothetical protein
MKPLHHEVDNFRRICFEGKLIRASGGGLPGVNANEAHFILSNHDSSFPFISHFFVSFFVYKVASLV